MRVLPALSLLFCCLAPSCGGKPSNEFDERPQIPTAPVAIPVSADDGADPDGMRASGHGGQALRDPRIRSASGDQTLSGTEQKATTYTYVPVISPRQLPGEKVTESRPSPAPPRRDPEKPTAWPSSAPLAVPPPAPAGPAPGAPQP